MQQLDDTRERITALSTNALATLDRLPAMDWTAMAGRLRAVLTPTELTQIHAAASLGLAVFVHRGLMQSAHADARGD